MVLKSSGWMRVTGVATVCALVGAGAGIAGSTAASSSSSKKSAQTRAAQHRLAGPRGFGPGLGFFGHGPAVHEESVVLDKTGKKFITQTEDRGTVKSVSGQDLTITEGTKDVTYKDVTLTIADDATVVRNGKKATLADLKAGDHVGVTVSSAGTFVFAADDTFRPMGPRGFGHRFGGRDHDGPPPAGAPAPGTYPGAP